MPEADAQVIFDSARSWYKEKRLRLTKHVCTSPEDQKLCDSWHDLLRRKKKLPVGLQEQVVSLNQEMIITATRSWYEKKGRKLVRNSKSQEDDALAKAWQELLKNQGNRCARRSVYW